MSTLMAALLVALLAAGCAPHEGHIYIEQRGFERGVAHVRCADGTEKLCHVRHCEKRALDIMIHCWREWEPCKDSEETK